jgi:mRNA-degrading endonuclease toxin of MazEF toxin-antitoxin module
VVVQADALNRQLDDTIIALVTSSPRWFTGSPSQLAIDIATADGRQAGLRLKSVVQCENLTTIEQTFVVRNIGQLSPALLLQLNVCLRAALGLSWRIDAARRTAAAAAASRRKTIASSIAAITPAAGWGRAGGATVNAEVRRTKWGTCTVNPLASTLNVSMPRATPSAL